MKEFKLQDLEKVGPTTEKKLNSAGIFTPLDIILRGTKEFSRESGLTMEMAEKHMINIKQTLVESGDVIVVNNITDLNLLRSKQIKTPLNVEELDTMFTGGVETQSLYEIWAEEGAGKTQLSLTVAVEALHNGYGVMFIDCEGTFDVERFNQINKTRGYDEYDIEKLGYHLWSDSQEIITGIRKLVPELIQRDVRYIIIDGLVGAMRLAYSGRGELYDRQNELEDVLKYLKNMSLILNLGVIITNQVTSNPEPFGPKVKAIGGHVLGHYVKYIISISKGMKNNRVARLIKSPKSAAGDYPFYINEEGVSSTETVRNPNRQKPKPVSQTSESHNSEVDNTLEEIEKAILPTKLKVFG